ncbi:MAG: hypothetical protein LWY06_11565 [Firmicutes bacterium]|nr:hypothetical protein [Bacillota bacterium]
MEQKDDSRRFYLREPMNLGEIIDATIDLFKKNIKDFTITSLVVAAPAIVLMLILTVINMTMPEDHESILAMVFIFVTFAVSFLIVIFYLNALIKMSSDFYNGVKTSFKEACAFSIKKFWKMTQALILSGIGFAVLFVITGMVFAGVTMATSNQYLAAGAAIIPFGFAIYYTFCIFLFPYVLVIEDAGVVESLKRSYELFRSSRNSMMKIILVPYLINALTIVATFIPFLGSFLVFLTYPLPIIAMTLVYYDIRIRSEGYDLMLQAEKLDSGL